MNLHWLCKIFNQKLRLFKKDMLAIRWGVLLAIKHPFWSWVNIDSFYLITSFFLNYSFSWPLFKERIQLETSRLYRQAGVNPLAGTFALSFGACSSTLCFWIIVPWLMKLVSIGSTFIIKRLCLCMMTKNIWFWSKSSYQQ